MSYAHEIFGVRETRHDIWMQDLLLAGTSSATFNSDRLREIAASPFVKDNGWAGYYMLLWCKYNNVPLNEIMRVGQKVAIRNSDYGTVDNYILNSMSATAAYFASANYIAYMPVLSSDKEYYDGIRDNTFIGAWLKAETPNWYSGINSVFTGVSLMVVAYGYSHGLPEEFKDLLKRNTSEPKNVNPFVLDDPYYLYRTCYSLGVRNEFGTTAIETAKIILDGNLSAKIRVGGAFWSAFIPTSSTQGNPNPLVGATWSEKPHIMATLTDALGTQFMNLDTNTVVESVTSAFPVLNNSYCGHLARFSVEI